MRRPERSATERAQDAYYDSYRREVGHLNRAERRTAYGRMRVAEAHAKALEEKVRVLEQALEDQP